MLKNYVELLHALLREFVVLEETPEVGAVFEVMGKRIGVDNEKLYSFLENQLIVDGHITPHKIFPPKISIQGKAFWFNGGYMAEYEHNLMELDLKKSTLRTQKYQLILEAFDVIKKVFTGKI